MRLHKLWENWTAKAYAKPTTFKIEIAPHIIMKWAFSLVICCCFILQFSHNNCNCLWLRELTIVFAVIITVVVMTLLTAVSSTLCSFASRAIYNFYLNVLKRSWKTCIKSRSRGIPIALFVSPSLTRLKSNECDNINTLFMVGVYNNLKLRFCSHLINRASKSGTCTSWNDNLFFLTCPPLHLLFRLYLDMLIYNGYMHKHISLSICDHFCC